MWYNLIRLIIWSIIFATVYYLVMKKTKITQKRRIVFLSFLLCLVLGTLSSLFPIENLFISFDDPEDVLKYIQGGTIEGVVHGNNSSMFITENSKDASISHFIIPRTDAGYKIPSFFSVQRILHKQDDISFNLYSVLRTNDYYIVGSIVSSEEISIRDSNNATLKSSSVKTVDAYLILFFGYIKNYTSEYYLLIDETIVAIS